MPARPEGTNFENGLA
jgi:hypothetical protein